MTTTTTHTDPARPMGLWSSASMGVGAMIGAGIFALLGQVASLAGSMTAWVFVAAAVVSMLSGYSYAKLGVRYPSSGGVAEYLVRGYGPGFIAGSLTMLLYLAMVVGMSLVARAFGAYGAAILPAGASPLWEHALTISVVVVLSIINAVGTDAVGRTERWIVAIKVTLLAAFVVAGLALAHTPPASPTAGINPWNLVHALALCLLAYQGFGVITNTVGSMPNPDRTLPRAIYLSLAVVALVYVGIAMATLANLSVDQIAGARDYALAKAAQPIFGSVGFTVVALTAMLSAASCINASLYSSANMMYMMVTVRELPPLESRRVWRGGTVGLFTTTALVIVVSNLIDLASIASLASLIFILIYACVHLGHAWRLTSQTGASRSLIIIAFLANAVVFVMFIATTIGHSPTLAGLFVLLIIISGITELVAHRVSGPIVAAHDTPAVPAGGHLTPADRSATTDP